MRFCYIAAFLCVAICSAEEEDLPWWKTAVFYQVYPRSFKDSDGDGIGDLKGITQNADYFKEIGVDAIWLSPIYESPMADFGYDVSNYTAIAPLFGTVDDFDELSAKLKEIGVKLLMDFVPNHSSDEHEWFKRSVNTSDPLHEDYKDFYVWRNASGYDNEGNPLPPNNWLSEFEGSTWEWREERKQFYLHHFTPKQPDLNYWCPNVISNMTAVLNYWLDKGVDGFRMDAVKYMFEDQNYPNEPPVPGTNGSTFLTLQHIHEFNQPQTHAQLRSWAQDIYERSLQEGIERVILLEVYSDLNSTIEYYGSGNTSLSFPFNFFLLTNASHGSRPADFKRLIDLWMDSTPDDGVPNWTVGNHDNSRVSDRFGPELVDAINMLTMVLPGVKVTYNGEEIGMRDTFIRWDQTVDALGKDLGPLMYITGSRDPERTPMQWDNTVSAGFSTNASLWLPVNPNYWWLNVASQRAAATSHMKIFQTMTKIKKDPVLQRGDLTVMAPNNDTFVVVRSYNNASYILIINMGSHLMTYNSQTFFAPNGLDVDMTVVLGSLNCKYPPGSNFTRDSTTFYLRPKAAILLRSLPSSPENSSGSQLFAISALICVLLALNVVLK